MAAMEKGDPVMIFAGYPNEMKEFLKSNPGLDSLIKFKFTFPDYLVQELTTFLDNGISDSGYRYSGQTSLDEIIESETTAAIRSQQNGRLAKNIVSEAIINLRVAAYLLPMTVSSWSPYRQRISSKHPGFSATKAIRVLRIPQNQS